jgi:hypothetical protein
MRNYLYIIFIIFSPRIIRNMDNIPYNKETYRIATMVYNFIHVIPGYDSWSEPILGLTVTGRSPPAWKTVFQGLNSERAGRTPGATQELPCS